MVMTSQRLNHIWQITTENLTVLVNSQNEINRFLFLEWTRNNNYFPTCPKYYRSQPSCHLLYSESNSIEMENFVQILGDMGEEWDRRWYKWHVTFSQYVNIYTLRWYINSQRIYNTKVIYLSISNVYLTIKQIITFTSLCPVDILSTFLHLLLGAWFVGLFLFLFVGQVCGWVDGWIVLWLRSPFVVSRISQVNSWQELIIPVQLSFMWMSRVSFSLECLQIN